jgi:hypothetical protein
VLEVLHRSIRAGIEQRLVAVILPAHQIRWPTVRSTNFEHLAVSAWFTDSVALDDDSISDAGAHRPSFD